MSTDKQFHFDAKKLFSWQFLLLKVLLLALVAVAVEKPTGGVAGHISLGEKKFGLHTYNLRANKVYVIAEGPRQGVSMERGVWVNQDGSFRIDHLPLGEYQLRVRAKGFTSGSQYGVFVEDGQMTELPKAITMDMLEPSVSLAQTSRVFTSDTEASLFLNVSGGTAGEVDLYKIDFLPFVQKCNSKNIESGADLNIYKGSDNADEKQLLAPLAQQAPLLKRPYKIDLDWTDAGHTQVNFGKLPKGDYFAYVEVQSMNGKNKGTNVTWFSVSDMGLVVKRDADKILVRAVDLVTLKPLKDCNVRGYDIGSKKYCTPNYKTNANGMIEIHDADAEVKTISPAGSVVASTNLSALSFFVGQAGQDRAYGGQVAGYADQSSYKTYFYTDKPIYRLGQTVSYKGIIRQEVNGELINIGASKGLAAHIEDPSNNQVWSGTVKTNKHGAFTGTFTIPADGSTGAYQLVVAYPGENANGNVAYGSFEVDQYRKPEFQVEVSSLTPRVVAGQKGRAQVKASYFFGAPVANAKVSYSIYSSVDWGTRWRLEARPDYYSFFDSWKDNDTYGSGGSLLTTGTTVTDENGLAIVEYDTKPVTTTDEDPNSGYNPYYNDQSDKQYRVEAEVTDISQMTQVASGSTEVTAGDFAMYITSDENVVKTGDSFGMSVQAVNYDGTPVKNQPITIQMERWTFDSVNRTYRDHQQVAELTCTTGADGKAKATIACKDQWESDTFYLKAITKDKFGNKISDHTSIWVSNYRYAYRLNSTDAEKEAVSITTDKEIYKPGDTAKIMITAPITGKEGVEAIVTVEGSILYQCKIVPLDSTAKLVEIPITKEMAPNAFIDVAFVGNKHQFYTAEQMVKVSPNDHFLKLAITSDKDKYKPGETAHYKIMAKKADGSPAAGTEVSLGVVDESIYSIRAEQAEDIQKFFYTRRENAVTTSCSFPVMYSAGPDKMEPKIRKDFRDTAAWMPELVTDKNGIAVADVKLPDNLTTWRATVRGVTMGTDVGSCVQKVLCTQDLILRLALPRFFNEGDEGYITAIVHNYTKRPQSIKLTLKASEEFTVSTSLLQTVTVEPEKAFRYSWPVTLAKSGTGVILAKAIGQTASDAMETKLPVNPLGLPAFSVKSGLLSDDNETVNIPVGMSSDAVKGTEKATLALASSSIGPVLGDFNVLIDYPYGCTEQTLSRMVPSMVAMQLHKRLNLPITDGQLKKFAEVQKQSLEKLKDYHHPDGGWGWWASDDSNPYLTAHVVSGLSMLKETGFSSEDQLISSGLKWLGQNAFDLQKALADPKLVAETRWDIDMNECRASDLAKMIYTMSQWSVTPEMLQEINNPKKESVPPVVANADKAVGAKTRATTNKFQAKKKKKPAKLVYHSEIIPFKNAGILAPQNDGDIKTPAKPEARKSVVSAPPHCLVREWLATRIEQLNIEALSYLVLASKNLGDEATAKKAYNQLIKGSSTDASMMNWDSSSTDYRFTAVEATALGLRAVVAMEPDNTERIEGIKQWLLLQHGKDGWDNTKTTAEVFMALLTEELQHKIKSPTAFEAKVTQDGQQLIDLAYDATNAYGPEKSIDFKVDKKPSSLDITKTGGGRLYYTQLITYFRKLLPGDQTAGKGIPAGLTINRKFFRLIALKEPAADGSIHFKTEEITDHKIKAGEVIMMKTYVNSPIPLPYVKIESGLPSGAEIVKSDSREGDIDRNQDASKVAGDWGAPWWTHEDDLDDKIVYFGSVVPKGESVFHTMLRMELPGKIEVLPTSLEAMYSNKIRGYSPLDQLLVKE